MDGNRTGTRVWDTGLSDGKTRTMLVWSIHMKRLSSPYFTAYYIPSTFIVALTFVSFWVPPQAYPARVALVVTNFLASCVIYRGADGDTPPTKNMNPLEMYLMMNMAYIMIVMLEYILVIVNVPIACGNRVRPGKNELTSATDNCLQLDRYARWIFPICYILTICGYFAYYFSRAAEMHY